MTIHATTLADMAEIHWMGTAEAAKRMGITPRTLYKFIDSGELTAYKIGRVIRLQKADVDAFLARCRIEPGTLEHLYPELRSDNSETDPAGR
jgi:excisionase family DNA binding protein